MKTESCALESPKEAEGAVPSAVRVVLRRAASSQERPFLPPGRSGSAGTRRVPWVSGLPFVNRAEERFLRRWGVSPEGLTHVVPGAVNSGRE